jgi:hypothetical protein
MASRKPTPGAEHWIIVDIPVACVTELGFHPHALKYEAEVLQYFPPSTRVRWFGHGRHVRPSDSGDVVLKTVWEFGVGDLKDAIKGFEAMFWERSFPDGTTITKVTKTPDHLFAFETLLTWPTNPGQRGDSQGHPCPDAAQQQRTSPLPGSPSN